MNVMTRDEGCHQGIEYPNMILTERRFPIVVLKQGGRVGRPSSSCRHRPMSQRHRLPPAFRRHFAFADFPSRSADNVDIGVPAP